MARLVQYILFIALLFMAAWWLVKRLGQLMLYRQPLMKQIAPGRYQEVSRATQNMYMF